ncbi:hypothetical protein A2643_03470 [Candidatus Nomurabacteria bacterium RIFCSPHIGHO2_01_FULL_39_220]|uniref:Uncharacterized protein n=1 Tax=Candidatus Nomurabacteria bacterium RIFCSPLOWO2_02_FULL_40_67 TaxID=1801787 RepID=A0A1F6Y2X2_9BACT|nr:MAG: hypothetical protein UU01_C0015G0004 [Parcubacteria group bacterium GW2011_GWA2_40_37]OGI62690.1 MAG: hypothetical protein A2W12_00725 [Candidatus Nomurabacteria bacterium RBG_16_40_11]OGI69415.1 MAG: hypothetical protein A2643_03470 [Candidatus Nomurabacteria bacterium RIFCSPHIGHO2_01_FULL_39_220]OGI72744.1 MAG: hypothetical protein A2W56_02910 [Candidatus Nomurabacteria bacterium RIFCSPHIGHO2_02_41_18]OGI78267.1 MAG: hypothetical protein A3C65_03445 [Candidatus Nomurabacteria bacteriu
MNNNMINKRSDKSDKMTIDKLAIMVANGFEEASRNLAKVENNLLYHIGDLDRRLDVICL